MPLFADVPETFEDAKMCFAPPGKSISRHFSQVFFICCPNTKNMQNQAIWGNVLANKINTHAQSRISLIPINKSLV